MKSIVVGWIRVFCGFALLICWALLFFRPPTPVYKSVGPDLIYCVNDYGEKTFFAHHVWVEEISPSKWQVQYPDNRKEEITGKCFVEQIISK